MHEDVHGSKADKCVRVEPREGVNDEEETVEFPVQCECCDCRRVPRFEREESGGLDNLSDVYVLRELYGWRKGG